MTNNFYGKHHTEESKKKISNSLKRLFTEERKKELSKKISGENNPMFGVRLFGVKNPFYGKHHTEEAREKIRKSANAKGWITSSEIERILYPLGAQVMEHRLVWCSQIGNPPHIPSSFIVHHLNLNKIDNHPDNLILLDNNTHNKFHSMLHQEEPKYGGQ